MSRIVPLACVALTLTCNTAIAQSQHVPPPGTIHLKDNLYIDKVPVSNIAYREFLFSVQHFWTEETHAIIDSLPLYGLDLSQDDAGIYITNKKGVSLVDSSNLAPDETLLERMEIPGDLVVDPAIGLTTSTYNNVQAYNNYPVVYVTHEQAAMFCKWRTDWVMLHYAISSANKSERKKYFPKITYRLITQEEWQYAYNNNAELVLSDFGTRQVSQKTFANYKPTNSRAEEASFSIYANNFAELLLEKKSIIGVLWNTSSNDSKKIITKSYAPASNVGFRCVCEVQ